MVVVMQNSGKSGRGSGLKFRQRVGRLSFTKSDTGIVVVLDNRILTKRYGQAFLDALPKCSQEIV